MHVRSFLRHLIRGVVIVTLLEICCVSCNENDHQSVGKLRSSADLALSKGEVDNALRLWEQIIMLEPNNDSNFYRRFRVYLRQNKLKEALSDLVSAFKINNKNEDVLVQKVKLEMRLGRCAEADVDLDLLKRYYIMT